MKENVILYLGQEDKWLRNFINQPYTAGDSAGLGLAFKRGAFQNHLPIAVTGAINEHGKVSSIGLMKEKVQIAEKAGFPFMIIPSENAKEVAAIQKEIKANVEIFAVSHVDEAVQLIQHLNDLY